MWNSWLIENRSCSQIPTKLNVHKLFSWPTHPSETNICFETFYAENRNSNAHRAEENLGTTAISSFLNLNKYCSFRLLYSWKVLASLKAWFKLWLSRFRWNVTVSRRVRGGGGRGALLFRLNGFTRSRKRWYFCTASGGTSKNLELKGKFLEYLRQLS